MFNGRMTPRPISFPRTPGLTYTSQGLGGTAQDYNLPYLPTGVSHACYAAGNRMITNATWDEGGNENSVWNLGSNTMSGGGMGTHGNGMHGGYAVCSNSTYVFSTGYMTTIKQLYDAFPHLYPRYVDYGGFIYDTWRWEGVYRKTLADPLGISYFNGGKGGFSGQTVPDSLGYFKNLFEYQETDHNVNAGIDATFKGICCTETEVFVSDPYNAGHATQGKIIVLDPATMNLTRSITINTKSFTHLAMAVDGNIWVAMGSTVKKLDKTTGATLTTVTPANPADKIGTLPDGRLWMSDSITKQIYIYNSAGTSLLTTFGTSGGFATNGGTIGTNAAFGVVYGFHTDDTNYWVMWGFIPGSYGTMACKYNAAGVEQSRIYSTQFIETADIDTETNKVYSRNYRFSFDKNASPQVALEAFTHDQSNTASQAMEPLFTVSTYVRKLYGRKYIYEFDQGGGNMVIYEIVNGTNYLRVCGRHRRNTYSYYSNIWVAPDAGIAAPVEADVKYENIETGQNDNDFLFQMVDSQGTCWRMIQNSPSDVTVTKLQKFPCQGLNAYGNPIYNWSSMVQEDCTIGILGAGTRIFQCHYEYETDTMVFIGYNNAHGIADVIYNLWNFAAGKVVKCYSNWTGRNGVRAERWTIYPELITIASVYSDAIKSCNISKYYLILGHMYEGICSVYRLSDGVLLAKVVSSGVTGSNAYWNDCAHSVRLTPLDSSGTESRIIQERGIGGSALLYSLTLRD